MTLVLAAAFEPMGRLHYFDPAGLAPAYGQPVLVPTGEGTEVAYCVWGPIELDWSGELPCCLGLAEPADLDRDRANRARRAEIAAVARRLIARHELPMRVVGVDFVDQSDLFDQQAVVYFESPGRVDFRALITDLARALQARIDLRQVGARDAAAIIGGVGSCGRDYCCASVSLPAAPVSAKLARAQDLPNNLAQLVGACGRLLCCLAYEHERYADFHTQAPRLGSQVTTPGGAGTVVGHVVPLDSVLVQVGGEQVRCPLSKCQPLPSASACPRRDT